MKAKEGEMYFRLDFLVDWMKLDGTSLVFDFSPHQPITIVLKAKDQTQSDTMTATWHRHHGATGAF